MKVLTVDDNADNLHLLEKLLRGNGYEVTVAHDGVEAMEHLRGAETDLIIADILMPRMDGFQLCREVKSDETLKDIPFVFYTATYTTEKDRRFALSLGASRFIVKPVDPAEFIKTIKEVLASGEKGQIEVREPELELERDYLREYSTRVTSKLERKIRQLEDAKAVIEAREQEWRDTFDAIGDCVTIHDMDFNIVLANKACEKVFGITAEEFRMKKCFELFHDRTEPREDCPKMQTEKSGKPSEAEFFEQTLNRWLSVACFPMLDKAGSMRGVVHFARDITARKKTEEQLYLFRTLIDQSNDALFVIEPPSGRILDVNDRACQSLGYSRQELLEKRIIDIEAAIPTDKQWQTHVQKLKSSGAMILEGVHVRKDKTTFPVEISVRYIQIPQADYMVAVVRDISDRMRDEQERSKLEAQLRQAQKMEAVGQLAGGIAHDFNNILSAIIGYASITQMKMQESDPLKLNIEQILASSERAAQLTHSLLAFSRKQVMNMKAVDLNEIVPRIGKFLSRVIGEDIELSIRLSNERIIVYVDPGQMEQVLMNLATNARDAMPRGGLLTIETSFTDLDEDFVSLYDYGKPGRHAVLTVSDTGAGMDEETRLRIFEPFYTTKDVGKGTGLGLAMVYGIVTQHNGFINCYSEPGKGTTFRIYLPVTSPFRQEGVPLVGIPLPPGRGSETVLVAEDDPSLRKLVRTVLTEFGYKVIEAVDGIDAVAKFSEHRDDIRLLVFDIIMPKKNGKEAYDEISRIKPDIKTIFLSGYSADVLKQKGIFEEGAIFLPKPVLPVEFLKKVREILDS